MPRRGLLTMSVQTLMELREGIGTELAKRRVQLEQQLMRIGEAAGVRRRGRPPTRGASLRGRKVPPKYRGPAGETWAGRGVHPRWWVALLKNGRKLGVFAIDRGGGAKQSTANVKR